MKNQKEFTKAERVAYYRARASLLVQILNDLALVEQGELHLGELHEKLNNTLDFSASRIEALEKQLWQDSRAARGKVG